MSQEPITRKVKIPHPLRLVEVVDNHIEIRWTWMPYWIASNGKVVQELEKELKTFMAEERLSINAEGLDRLHTELCDRIQARFPAFYGLGDVLKGFRNVAGDAGAF